jgi:hypothetical protein
LSFVLHVVVLPLQFVATTNAMAVKPATVAMQTAVFAVATMSVTLTLAKIAAVVKLTVAHAVAMMFVMLMSVRIAVLAKRTVVLAHRRPAWVAATMCSMPVSPASAMISASVRTTVVATFATSVMIASSMNALIS